MGAAWNHFKKLAGSDLRVAEDGDGAGAIFSNRNTAFFQARSYLIAKKTAHYVEQFEGLYAMMRGLACAFVAGACYLAGWSLAFHSDQACLRATITTFTILSAAVALASSFLGLSRNREVNKFSVIALAISLLMLFLCAGFWVFTWQPSDFSKNAPPRVELILWVCVCVTLIAAARCFSAYRSFAFQFAQSVWRDFSVYLTVKEAKGSEDGDGEGEAES